MKKHSLVFMLFAIVPSIPRVFGQDGVATIKAEVLSAFVWGEDSPSGAVSSNIRDPLTGNAIHKLSYGGIEISSRLGFEAVGDGERGTFFNYTTTIVNKTDTTLSIRYGGISVDGRPAPPLWTVPPGRKLNKKERKSKPHVVELEKMHCFTSGFLSSDNLFSADTTSRVLSVAPGTALRVSSVIRDPREYHPLRCSVEGCFPTGMIRYHLTVNTQDFVFPWSGQSAIYCGK